MSNTRWFRVLLINMLIAASLILTFGIAGEYYFRFYVPSPDYRGLCEKTSDSRLYAMKPNMDIVRQGVRIMTNIDGFRDKEFKDALGEDRFVIAVLGDSYTFGQGVPQDKTFPSLLENTLNQSAKTDYFRVWNLGVSGYNTEQEDSLLRSFVLPRAPKWVVVGYNVNDYEPAYPLPDATSTNGGKTSMKPSWIQEVLDRQLFVLSFARGRIGSLIRIFKPQWRGSSYVQDVVHEYLGPGDGWKKASRLLSEMNRECTARGIGFTVAILPAMFDCSHHPFEGVHQMVVSYCRSSGIYCVDVTPQFRGKKSENLVVSVVDPHPGASAQEVFADAVASHLLSVIPLSGKIPITGNSHY